MKGRYRKLFEPVQIGSLEIKNRIAMAPMGLLGLLNVNGTLGPRALDYYLERARGNVGLIITGLFRVENEIEPLPLGVPLINHGAIASFAELAESLHAWGTKVFIQVTAGIGRVIMPHRLQTQPVSASAIPNYWEVDKTCRELKTEEVEKLVQAFGRAAAILKGAGIDGVELHGHEGYLFDQFTTAAWNRRTDKYGGNLEGRLRLPVEVCREIKKCAGRDFVVQYRYGLKHYMKGWNDGALPGENFQEFGRDAAEGLEMAGVLERAGFDALHVDAGCYDSWYWPHPPVYQAHGCMLDMAAAVKRRVKIPVIAVGKMEIPELAERAVAEGKADLVALGKGLLADAFWALKVAEGQGEKIRPCIGCHDGCMGRVFKGKPLSCAVNPATGRERRYRLERTENPLKIVVAGGGVAGLEAARVAALRGHAVTLYEQEASVGGHLLAASVPDFKEDVARLLDWYRREIRDLPVTLKLGTKFTPEAAGAEKPQVLILAAGSKPFIPEIPGIHLEKVATATDVLLGRKNAGDRVVVLGGGLIGCETALWLAKQGKKVTIVEILGELMSAGIPVQHMNRIMLLDLLKFHGVKVTTNASLLEVTGDGAWLMDRSFRRQSLPADTLVLAVGMQPNQELYKALRSEIPRCFLIGDARSPQNIMNAVWDAYEISRLI